jgi:hypothetical protein
LGNPGGACGWLFWKQLAGLKLLDHKERIRRVLMAEIDVFSGELTLDVLGREAASVCERRIGGGN